jgi:hypothetical protein
MSSAAAAAAAGSHPVKLHIRASSDPRSVFVVDAKRVWHVPPPLAAAGMTTDVTHVLCPYLDAFGALIRDQPDAWGRCPREGACTFVHADLRGATKYTPHLVAVAWDAPQSYAWCPSGGVVALTQPPAAGADAESRDAARLVTVPSGSMLRTRAVDVVGGSVIADAANPPSICAHFAGKERCDRGARCKFAHVMPGAWATASAATQQQRRGSGSETPLAASCEDSFLMPTPLGSATPKVGAAMTPSGMASRAGTPDSEHLPLPVTTPPMGARPCGGSNGRHGWRHDPYAAVAAVAARASPLRLQ